MAITTKTIMAKPNSLQYPRTSLAIATEVFLAHIKLAWLTTFALLILFTLSDFPFSAILAMDILFCGYLVSLFKNKYKYLFLLNPIILFASSQLFTGSFLSAGDGDPYLQTLKNFFNTQDLSFAIEPLLAVYTPLEFFNYASLGALPTFTVPEYFFGNPIEEIYYLWQATFHVFLSLTVITLARAWRILEAKYLFAIALFLVISPTCFELGNAPTRHYVTLFGIFLLLTTHMAILQHMTFSRILWYTIAIIVIIISKSPLMAPYFIYFFFDIFVIRKLKLNITQITLLLVSIFVFIKIAPTLLTTILSYKEISEGGAASFSGYTQIPIIGWIVKYIYALVSPFPWSNVQNNIENFTGNWLMFLMHILSALTGLYLFFIVILKWRPLLACDMQIKQFIAFALIMSLSILKGAIGFHFYLSIFFPMMAPLFTIKQLQINIMLPICFVLILEAFVVFSK